MCYSYKMTCIQVAKYIISKQASYHLTGRKSVGRPMGQVLKSEQTKLPNTVKAGEEEDCNNVYEESYERKKNISIPLLSSMLKSKEYISSGQS